MKVKIQLTIEGDLPEKYTTPMRLEEVRKKVENDAKELFGEYEIWGEFFGNDDQIYTLFLKSVKAGVVRNAEPKKESEVKKLKDSAISRFSGIPNVSEVLEPKLKKLLTKVFVQGSRAVQRAVEKRRKREEEDLKKSTFRF